MALKCHLFVVIKGSLWAIIIVKYTTHFKHKGSITDFYQGKWRDYPKKPSGESPGDGAFRLHGVVFCGFIVDISLYGLFGIRTNCRRQ